MNPRSIVPGLLALLLVLPVGGATACEWDYDTLEMERQRFPEVLELITGKFTRHSYDFYRWRVADRTRRIEADPADARLYDDLAVAYDKLGEQASAIETISKVDEFAPGRYETLANLGTFHVHAGDHEKGLEYLRQAVEINPDAHFGREIYQILLVEYVLSKRAADGTTPQPLSTAERAGRQPAEFAAFVLEKQGVDRDDEEASAAELARALEGVLGMLRFGKHDSPVLLEAAGDLLLANNREDGKRLATRAYLKASYEARDDAARDAYRALAERTISMQHEVQLAEVEADFRRELEEADTWYAEVLANEQRWIDEGGDVDAKFSAMYYAEPRVAGGDEPLAMLDPAGLPLGWRIAIAVVLVLSVGAVLLLRWKRPVPPL